MRGFLRISQEYLANTCSGYDSDNQPQVIEMMRMNNAGCYIPSFISETRTFDNYSVMIILVARRNASIANLIARDGEEARVCVSLRIRIMVYVC